MIQRIQTLFLFLAFLFNGTVFFNPLYSHAMQDPKPWIGTGFAVVLTVAALMSLGCIFLYKNRPAQMTWVKRTMLIQIASLGWGAGILFSLGGFGLFLWDELLGVALLLLGLIAEILALRNIKKDEELVRSMDRIR
ncbi:DUF4293 family protein [Halalkalibaculum sp. DA384]|uniref:DUF4293 family protein n=1 Tax=Halalkalibaculum sp. DA384 TaxID=3373606 RepID=UPI003754FBA5